MYVEFRSYLLIEICKKKKNWLTRVQIKGKAQNIGSRGRRTVGTVVAAIPGIISVMCHYEIIQLQDS